MILYVPPDAPFAVKAGADLLLVGHIGGGSLGILSGFTAFFAKKGGRLHRLAGDVFVVSMLVMAVIGTLVSPFLPTPQPGNISGGFMTCYAVGTGWATARRKDGGLGRAQTAAMAIPALMIPALVFFGVVLFNAPGREAMGVPFIAPVIMAVVAASLLAADVRVLVRGALTSAQRLARHLWRMGLGLLMATGSALGQERITNLIPTEFRTLPIMLAPIVLIIGLIAFWQVRVRAGLRRPTGARPVLAGQATA